MHRNHLVWAEIESITARYQMTDSDGKTTPDTEKQIIARRSLLALRNFFLKNNLLANKKINTRDKNIERNFYFNDFTEEGIELLAKSTILARLQKCSEKSSRHEILGESTHSYTL